jgi:hypothetical protein
MIPRERAQYGVTQIEDAIVELLAQRGEWMSRSDIATGLDIDRLGDAFIAAFCNELVKRRVLEFRVGPQTLYSVKK